MVWLGSSYKDLLAFPLMALKASGYQLGRIQLGLEPDDWKLFESVGAGTREIRVREESGAYRVMYVAKFDEAIYVLHCFQKKTQATSRHDRELAATRYREMVALRRMSNDTG